MRVVSRQSAILSLTAYAILVALCCSARAQQSKPVPVIGWLWYGSAPAANTLPPIESAIIDGLRELGYMEGKNLKFEHRYAEGRPEKLPELARDLAGQKIDVILVLGGDLASAAKKATSSTPIVMGLSEDPVSSSLVTSLAQPGGNITGVSFLSDKLAGKRLELLREINPRLTRAAVLWNPNHFDNELKEIQTVAQAITVRIKELPVQRPGDLENALTAIVKDPVQGLIVVPSRLTNVTRSQIAAAAIKLEVPMISGWREFAEAGGFASSSYGPDRLAITRRLASYIDRVLKGAKPATLPVEQPTKFELVINLKRPSRLV